MDLNSLGNASAINEHFSFVFHTTLKILSLLYLVTVSHQSSCALSSIAFITVLMFKVGIFPLLQWASICSVPFAVGLSSCLFLLPWRYPVPRLSSEFGHLTLSGCGCWHEHSLSPTPARRYATDIDVLTLQYMLYCSRQRRYASICQLSHPVYPEHTSPKLPARIWPPVILCLSTTCPIFWSPYHQVCDTEATSVEYLWAECSPFVLCVHQIGQILRQKYLSICICPPLPRIYHQSRTGLVFSFCAVDGNGQFLSWTHSLPFSTWHTSCEDNPTVSEGLSPCSPGARYHLHTRELPVPAFPIWFLALRFSSSDSRSFTYMVNSTGDRLSPCFTSLVVLNQSVKHLLILTAFSVSVYRLSTASNIFPVMPVFRSLNIRSSRSTQSKAFLKSTKHAYTSFPLVKEFLTTL